ncbi:MAG: family 16 glycosylhydrolase [Paludibacter sp.]|nr:family 16 glycosylhydrolase [Bacteroidales bacterium]MCM1068659.1 family 16 glycosylhydrolase [Prevotella sp.]MCM1353323.1 family 16 glycosylhydrolase [Bacteroides sp.]MCM1442269.1 family 16 glycosylhydrolase [Muribaculum sp.]MCM1481088.1 family 16 glycosylhydrolase [Paludibacter sp.]
MNLFFKKLTGSLLSTYKLEARMKQYQTDIVRYRQVEASAELAEYNKLKELVDSKEFQQKKQQLTQTKYKATVTYQKLAELQRLTKNKALQRYFFVGESAVLADYLAFRASENYVKLTDKKMVKQSPELQRMLKFEKSKAYKTWLAYKDSELPKRYNALKEETASEVFQKENVFWANPRRWLTTEEYKQESRLAELAASADIVFFLAQDRKHIEEMEAWKTVFADDFDWRKMTDSAWRPGFCYKGAALKREHSFVNEHQANNGGRNTGTLNGNLTILTQKENVTAAAWDEKKGFVNKAFDYTSDVISTGDTFRSQEGLFMAKIRCSGKVHHTFWLGAGAKTPLVHLFNYNGKKLFVGNTSASGFNGTTVSGIGTTQYYIYSLRWTKTEMVWYVNNIEVFRTNRNMPTEPLYLAVSSFLPIMERPAEGKMEVDWVRVYTAK